MINIGKIYANRNRISDLVKVESIEYDDGIKCVFFFRFTKDRKFRLPIEMFEKNFQEVPSGYE